MRFDVESDVVTHRWVKVNGVQLHYVEAGARPLVVLLHGFPEFWYAWRHQIPTLAGAGYRVAAPGLRGYNLSDKPPGWVDYRCSILAQDIANLIGALGAGSAAVVGTGVERWLGCWPCGTQSGWTGSWSSMHLIQSGFCKECTVLRSFCGAHICFCFTCLVAGTAGAGGQLRGVASGSACSTGSARYIQRPRYRAVRLGGRSAGRPASGTQLLPGLFSSKPAGRKCAASVASTYQRWSSGGTGQVLNSRTCRAGSRLGDEPTDGAYRRGEPLAADRRLHAG